MPLRLKPYVNTRSGTFSRYPTEKKINESLTMNLGTNICSYTTSSRSLLKPLWSSIKHRHASGQEALGLHTHFSDLSCDNVGVNDSRYCDWIMKVDDVSCRRDLKSTQFSDE